MNTRTIITIAALGLCAGAAVFPARSFAVTSAEKVYLDSYRGRSHDVPIPTFVETPAVGYDIIHAIAPADVILEFVVDKEGYVEHLRVVDDGGCDFDVTIPVTNAVYGWRFEPAIKNGKPVATKVRLEIDFTEEEENAAGPASPANAQKGVAKVAFKPLVVVASK